MLQIRKPAVFLFGLISFATYLLAQAMDGNLVGTVTDRTGALLTNASILVENESTGVKTGSETDSAGKYRIANLQPGPYKLTVNMPGFTASTVTHIQVETGTQKKAESDARSDHGLHHA